MSGLKCPHCDKPVCDETSLNCIYCGNSLECDTGFLSRLRYPSPRVIVLLAVMLIAISFLMLVLK